MKTKLLPVFVLMIFLAGTFSVSAYTDYGSYLSCNSCSDCTAALNSDEADVVRLSIDIINQEGTCIEDPFAFRDKAFDCRGHRIDGVDSGTSYGIHLDGKSFNRIANCEISDFGKGVYLGPGSSEGVTIENNIFNSNGAGLHLESVSDSNLLKNDFFNNTEKGIYLSSSSSQITIENNVLGSNDNGIFLASSSNNLLSNNRLTSNKNGAVLSSSSGENEFSKNTFRSNKKAGVSLRQSSDFNFLKENTFEDNGAGVKVKSSSGSEIINNEFTLNGKGIWLISADSNNMFQNELNSNDYGVYAESTSTNNLVKNNTISSSVRHGVYLSSSNSNKVVNNELDSNYNGIFIRGDSTGNNLSSNTFLSNTEGVFLNDAEETTIGDNAIKSNGIGIHLLSADDNKLLGNNINGSEKYGFLIDKSTDNTLEKNSLSSRNSTMNLFVNGTNSSHFDNTIPTSNTVGNGSVYYFYNVSGSELSGSDASHVTFAYSDGVTVEDIDIEEGDPIYLYETDNSVISKNSVSESHYGIYLISSSSNVIENNSLKNNERGMFLKDSPQNDLLDNLADNNNEYGVYIYNSPKNNLLRNSMSNNSKINLFVSGDGIDEFNQSINTSNKVNGDKLYYFINESGIFLNGNFNQTSHVTVAYSDDITIAFMDIAEGDPIHLVGTDNSRIRDSSISGGQYGIYMTHSSKNNSLEDNTLRLNSYGMHIRNSPNNELTNNSMSDSSSINLHISGQGKEDFNQTIGNLNTVNGGPIEYHFYEPGLVLDSVDANHITVAYSDGASIRNATILNGDSIYVVGTNDAEVKNSRVSGSYQGAYFSNSDNSVIRSNNFRGNRGEGIRLEDSSDNSVLKNDVTSNSKGLFLTGSSSNNEIKENTISSNDKGIDIFDSGSSGNLIFNNRFRNNDINAVDLSTTRKNKWNTSRSEGTNIIGGDYIGGNFWNDYGGTDRNSDGIGDTNLPYNSKGNIKAGGDYLPLIPLPPKAEIISLPNTTKFGDPVYFNGRGFSGTTGRIVDYEWNSSINGKLSEKRNFTSSSLKVGVHNITFRVLSSDGFVWSEPASKIVKVKVQDFGTPAKVLPRFVTKRKGARTYNMPAQARGSSVSSFEQCEVKTPYGQYACGGLNVSKVDRCLRGEALENPILDFRLNKSGTYRFLIGTGDDLNASRVGVGDVSLRMVVGETENETNFTTETELNLTTENETNFTTNKTVWDFGTLTDKDVFPNGYKILFETGEEVDKRQEAGEWYSGAFYSLYRVRNCKLTEDIPFSEVSRVGDAKDKFVAFVAPSTCSMGETCSYVGELSAFDGNAVGGVLFKFNYRRPETSLFLNQSELRGGVVLAGETASKNTTVTALNTSIYDLAATSTSEGINLSLDNNDLSPHENTTLRINITAGVNETSGLHRKYFNLSWKTLANQTESATFLSTYKVYLPESDFLVSSSSYDFGLVGLGSSESVDFSLENIGNQTITNLSADVPDRYNSSLTNDTLKPNETMSLTITLEVPEDAKEGQKEGEAVLTWDRGKYKIPLKYNASLVVPSQIKVIPSEWNIGTLAPASGADQTFDVSLVKGEAENTTVKIKGSDSSVFSFTPASLNLGKGEKKVNASFTAPESEGTYEKTLSFSVYENEKTQTFKVPVRFSVELNVKSLIDSARKRADNTEKALKSIRAQVVKEGPAYKQIKDNLTRAEGYISDARETLNEAQSALSEGNEQEAKDLVSQANSKLSKVDTLLEVAENSLNKERKSFLQKFKYIFIVAGVGIAVAVFFLALREGWLPPKVAEMLGLKQKRKRRLKSRPRFTPEAPVSLPSEPEGPSKEKRKKKSKEESWKEYYQKHPEFKEIEKKQKKRAYSNKRFK